MRRKKCSEVNTQDVHTQDFARIHNLANPGIRRSIHENPGTTVHTGAQC